MSRNLQDLIRREVHSLQAPEIPNDATFVTRRGFKSSSFTTKATLLSYDSSKVRKLVYVHISVGLNALCAGSVWIDDASRYFDFTAPANGAANVSFELDREPVELTDDLVWQVISGAPTREYMLVNYAYFEWDA